MTPAFPAIRPISDLRTDLNGICEQAAQSQQPIFMTKNGKASLVVIDCEAYERQRQHDRYVLKLREAELEQQYHPETVTRNEVSSHVSSIIAQARELFPHA
ncbi:type II toxin-antitoxin system Phd/YefM family antitoxin [Parvibacter caecicola]|uniref:type II toxin-antitoxin system Phd/YefM family antitoxin n=1 Tax=Parvibacter caecicola TaxID=747645 RepID=UPI00273178A8|nr:type II toxin-antitoxin system Phd/YefM family antitoxin [Parvibacter caecicola]